MANYLKFNSIMTKIKDAIEGEDAIKQKRETYLPRLTGMVKATDGAILYELYLNNSMFFPATGRTLDAYMGMLFRRNPILIGSESLKAIKDKISFGGQSIDQLAVMASEEIISQSRCAILVDYPDVNTDGMTVAQVEEMQIRPYLIFYPQSAIIDWKEIPRWGQKELRSVTIQETVTSEGMTLPEKTIVNDGMVTTRRILSLEMIGSQDVYVNRVYVKTETKEEWVLISEKMPMANGKTFNEIPIIPCSVSGEWELDYPILNDITNLNMADYRNEALYRDCLLFLGRPTACVSGLMQADGQTDVYLGPHTVLQFRDGGNWGLLSGDPNSAGALREESNRLKQQMAIIGARSLAQDIAGVESAETASIHRAGENGMLSQIAKAVSRSLSKALTILSKWGGYGEEARYVMNVDFSSVKADIITIQTLFAQYLQGMIPLSVLYHNIEKAELLPDGMTIEEFEKETDKPMQQTEPLIFGQDDNNQDDNTAQ